MERSCDVHLLAKGTGTKPQSLPHETARLLFGQIGAPQFGWFPGQPLFDRILKEQADLVGWAGRRKHVTPPDTGSAPGV